MAGKMPMKMSKSAECGPPPGMHPKKTASKPKGGYGGSGMAKKGK